MEQDQTPNNPPETTQAQITPNPYKIPKYFKLSKFLKRFYFFPFFNSKVALTTQMVNPYFLKHGIRYKGDIWHHLLFIEHRLLEGGFTRAYRGLIPYLLASYERELGSLLLIELQRRGVMPVDHFNLKKAPKRDGGNGNGQNQGQNQAEDKQKEADLKEADRLREKALQAPTTPLSLLRYFACDFGVRALGNLIFWPLHVLSVGQITDLGPEPEFETSIQRAVSIWEKEGFRGFYRGLKYKLVATLITSVAKTTQWVFKKEWFGMKSFRTGLNQLMMSMVVLPLVGFARMRIISDDKIDWFSMETGVGLILHCDLQITLLTGYLALKTASRFFNGFIDYQQHENGGFRLRVNFRGGLRNENNAQNQQNPGNDVQNPENGQNAGNGENNAPNDQNAENANAGNPQEPEDAAQVDQQEQNQQQEAEAGQEPQNDQQGQN